MTILINLIFQQSIAQIETTLQYVVYLKLELVIQLLFTGKKKKTVSYSRLKCDLKHKS